MKQRIITGVFLAAVLLPIVFSMNVYIYGALSICLGIMSAYELSKMYNNKFLFWIVSITSTLSHAYVFLGCYNPAFIDTFRLTPFTIIIIDFLVLATITVFKDKKSTFIFENMLSIVYIGFGYTALVAIYGIDPGYFIYVLFVSLCNDIFAYFVGVKFGKHKLAPTISPKKTVEGFVGGIVLGSLIGYIAYGIMFEFEPVMFLVGIFLALSGVVGDLFASKLKRDNNIKDFGKILPGHGGVLDRFDSILVAGLCYYIYFMVIL